MFYSPTERLIYVNPLNASYDPLAIHRQLVRQSIGKVNEWIANWNADDPLIRAEAEEQLVVLSRSVFNLKPITDADGHSDSQSLAILEHYLRYAEGKV